MPAPPAVGGSLIPCRERAMCLREPASGRIAQRFKSIGGKARRELDMPGIAFSFIKATVTGEKMEGQSKGYGVRPSDFTFFFQAEDGIRDVAVTGVQTCALPISEI